MCPAIRRIDRRRRSRNHKSDNPLAGQANVMSQVGVQLSLAFGVALGGGVLEGVRLLQGGAPLLADFHWAFWLMAAITLVAAMVFTRLPRTASMHSHHAQDEPAE